MKKPEPVFEVDLGPNGGLQRFYSHDGLAAFIDAQITTWSWVHTETLTNDGNIHRVRDILHHWLVHAKQYHVNWQADPTLLPQFESVFRQAFASTPLAGSPKETFISELRSDKGPITAAAALGYFIGIVADIQFAHPLILRGVLSAFAFEENLNSKAASSTRRSIEGLVSKFSKSLANLEGQARDEAARYEEAESHALRSVNVMNRFVRLKLRRHERKHATEMHEAIKRIDDTRDLYQQFMQLRGPVDYWMSKARAHQRKAKIHWDRLMKIAGWGGAGVLATLILVAKIAFDQAKTAYANQPATLYLVLVTIGVVVTTMVFWAIRIQVRLYMS
ncbi:hypothetical protein FHR70_000809 [Microvirga lupini]|uniref:Uncharacterized protein n=1 Tax=Microvirga lupini TaxID=420324 RepID=A0A7W4VIE3_9HYPH|nr:hypothetical protein [Microvirga lupini]MBB3017769.1 hypothetical protein [Microvirga lupini]